MADGAGAKALDATGLDKADAGLGAVIGAGDLSGAVTLVWRKGEVVRVTCQGRRNLATGAPMTRDTIFRIASMSKPVTSAAILMLAEEGRLSLEDPITRWAPEFADMVVLDEVAGPLDRTSPARRAISIEDLLTHRAGLAYGFGSVGPIAHAHEAALGPYFADRHGPDAWMKALAGLPLSYQPGERFHYSHATDVLGFLIPRITGQGFREFLIERIFQPLGMADTDFYIPPAKRDRAALVYRQDDESGALSEVDFAQYDTPPAFCGGGGQLVSTADDYLKFARLLLGGGEVDGVRLLQPKTVATMRANRLTDEQRALDFLGIPFFWGSQGFGLGVSVVTDPVKHQIMGAASEGAFGWPGAFGTWWQADPQEDMILIYLIQNSMDLGPEAVANLGDARRMGARLALPLWQKAVYDALT
jgi:CubicO group peptidase (beta-lactamase class C family)